MTYREVQGDLFDFYGKAFLVHCVSADFALGKGIAKQFDQNCQMKKRLRQEYPDYLARYRASGMKGDALWIDSVVNLVTKERYYQKPTYQSLQEALEKLADRCRADGVADLAMPLIACGLDGLEWDKVSAMIQDVFRDTVCNITVVER